MTGRCLILNETSQVSLKKKSNLERSGRGTSGTKLLSQNPQKNMADIQLMDVSE
jgi:hypothetical protein